MEGDGGDKDRDDEDLEPRRSRKGREVVMYRVGAGDTLIGIAKQFAIDADDVAWDNKLDAWDALKAGQLLELHVRKSVLESVTTDDARKEPASKGEANDDEPRGAKKKGDRPLSQPRTALPEEHLLAPQGARRRRRP